MGTLTLTYDILGAEIMLSNGNSDGRDVVGQFDFEVEVKASDIAEFYGVENIAGSREVIRQLMYQDVFEGLESGEDDDFVDFMKEKYEEEAYASHEEEQEG